MLISFQCGDIILYVYIIELVKLKAQLTFFQVKSFLTYNAQHFYYENNKSIRIIENQRK